MVVVRRGSWFDLVIAPFRLYLAVFSGRGKKESKKVV